MLTAHQLSTGSIPLLAFHGMGQDHRCFEPLARVLQGRYALYAFDLFYHGTQPIQELESELTKADWQALIRTFLEMHGISRFAVAGFSMGGKFALATAEAFPQQIETLFLMAPDGITISPWYRLATGTAPGRHLFRLLLKSMPLFQRTGQVLSALRLVHPSTIRVAENMLLSPQRRNQIYNAWIQFRQLTFDMRVLASLFNTHSIPVYFYAGRSDLLLPVSYIEPLARRLDAYQLTVLPTGHYRLIDKVAQYIRLNGGYPPPPVSTPEINQQRK